MYPKKDKASIEFLGKTRDASRNQALKCHAQLGGNSYVGETVKKGENLYSTYVYYDSTH